MKANDFKQGDQILYIPNHAEGDRDHPDCEFGFVTSTKINTVFCRYWRNRPWSNKPKAELRTRYNSEGTDPSNLIKHDLFKPEIIQAKLDYIRG